jgi:hypothetical protein
MVSARRVAFLALLALAPACRFDARGIAGQPVADDLSLATLETAPPPPDGGLAFPDAEPMQPVDGAIGVDLLSPDLASPPDLPSPDLPRPDLLVSDAAPVPCAQSCRAGCCAGEVCGSGVEHVACGGGGKACVDCSALGQQCVNMACVAIACSTTAACPADKVCSAKTCVSPYGLDYRIWVQSAVIANKTWDPQSGPDPYVLIKIGTKAWTTKTVWDSLTPTWNQYVDHRLTATTALRFEVYDADSNGAALIGVVELKPGVPATVLHAGSTTGSGGDVKSLKLAFELR